ncbi:MAG: flagellar motor switch protein FliN [Burkholderiaceae bacterium]
MSDTPSEQSVEEPNDAAPDQAATSEADWGEAMSEQAAHDASVSTKVEFESTASADKLFPKLSDTGNAAFEHNGRDLSMLMDIPVQLTVELGRARIPIKHILQLAQGSVIELEALAGEPMDVFVNGCLIAQGEVVVVNEKFGVRLTDIVTPSERLRRIK